MFGSFLSSSLAPPLSPRVERAGDFSKEEQSLDNSVDSVLGGKSRSCSEMYPVED